MLQAHREETAMTLCPIAIAVGCKKCPAFSVCPLKTVIGDYRPDEHPQHKTAKATAKKKAGGGK
jgi:hypothetical protein